MIFLIPNHKSPSFMILMFKIGFFPLRENADRQKGGENI
jgi:hypothetical protein